MRRPPHALLVAVGTLSAIVAARAAAAQSTAARGGELHWSAPSGCPDEPAVRAAVERALGRPIAPPGAERLVVDATLASAAHARGFRLRLATRAPDGTTGERALENASCTRLADAAALVIALAIDPDAVAAHDAPSVPPAAPVAPATPIAPVAPVRPPPRAPAPARARRATPWSFATGASLALEGNALRVPAPALDVHVALARAFVRVELRGEYAPPQRTLIAGRTDGGDIGLATLAARACVLPLSTTVEFGVCAGLDAGAMFAHGVRVDHAADNAFAWIAPALGLFTAVRPTRGFALLVRLEGTVPIERYTFVLVDIGDVFQPPPVTLRASLGAEVRFP